MKKNFVKLGALAVAVTLALVFAACAQPTDESTGAGTPTIIRLYLDRQAAPEIGASGPTLQLFVGTVDADSLETGAPRWVNNTKDDATSIPGTADYDPIDTLYLESAVITPLGITAGVPGNIAVDVEDGKGYYIDIELINLTYDSVDFGKTYSGSDSFYLACEVATDVVNGLAAGTYYYTPDHMSVASDPLTAGTTWDQVQTVDLSPGINEIRLKYFNN